ncbi:MAG: hypothetical protein ACO2O6_03335 [Candidatus Hydrothermia bacterium]|jgi:hypothetical protein
MLKRKVVIFTRVEKAEERERAVEYIEGKDFSIIKRMLRDITANVNFKNLTLRQIEQLLLSIPTPWNKVFIYHKFLEDFDKSESEKFILNDLIYNEISGILYTIALYPENLKVEKIKVEKSAIIFKDPLFEKFQNNGQEIEMLFFNDIPIAIYNKEKFLIPKIIYDNNEKNKIISNLGKDVFFNHFLSPIESLDVSKLIKFYKFIEFLLKLKDYLGYNMEFEKLLEKLKEELRKKLHDEEMEKLNREVEKLEKIKNDERLKEKYDPLDKIVNLWKNLEEEISDYSTNKIFKTNNDKIIILPSKDKEKKSRILYSGYPYTKEGYEMLRKNKDSIEKQKGIKFIEIEKYFSPKLVKIKTNDYLLPISYKRLIEDVNDKEVIDKILEGIIVEDNKVKTNYGYEELIFQKEYNEIYSLDPEDLIICFYPWIENVDKYYLFIYISDNVSRNVIDKIEIYPKDIVSENGIANYEIKDDNHIKGRLSIYELKSIPTFICFDGRETQSIYYINKEKLTIKNNISVDNITIAVDIGTTNTIIKYKEEEKESKIFDFGIKEGLLKVFIPSKNDNLEKKLAKIFLIDKTHETYKDIFDDKGKGFFRTLLYTFKADESKSFISSHIYIGKEEKDNRRIQSNIKWEKKDELKKYINQLSYFINVFKKFKNAREVKVIYSYPTSMENELIDHIKNEWEKSLEEYEIRKLENFPESIAIFYSEDRRGADLGCAIDIGGGSTDFCVWSKNEIIGHFSIKYAGEDIIVKNLKEITNKSESEIRAKLDKNEFILWIEKKEDKEKAKKLIGLSYICLFTTIGNYLVSQVKQEEKKYFYIGFLGNGSRGLRYVFENEKEVIKNVFVSTLGVDNPEIDFSREPKHEVVNGLLNPYIEQKEDESRKGINFFDDIKEIKEDIQSYFDTYFNIVNKAFKEAFNEELNIDFNRVYSEFMMTDAGNYLRDRNKKDLEKNIIKMGKPITLLFGEIIIKEFVKTLKGGGK